MATPTTATTVPPVRACGAAEDGSSIRAMPSRPAFILGRV